MLKGDPGLGWVYPKTEFGQSCITVLLLSSVEIGGIPRVEHIFGTQAQIGGHIVRTIGYLRARLKIGMMNLVYNMVRVGDCTNVTGEVRLL